MWPKWSIGKIQNYRRHWRCHLALDGQHGQLFLIWEMAAPLWRNPAWSRQCPDCCSLCPASEGKQFKVSHSTVAIYLSINLSVCPWRHFASVCVTVWTYLCLVSKLKKLNNSGVLYFMLLDTCAVKPLLSISQNRSDSKYIKQNETENQLKILSNFKYYQSVLQFV
jgi:hypothetical protein